MALGSARRPDAASEALLRDARTAHLATSGRDSRPHVVPICYVWRDGVLYTPLDRKPKRSTDPRRLRRVRNIAENPRVAVVIDRYEEDWDRLAYVLVEGTASVLESGSEYRAAAEALVEKYPQYEALSLAGRPIIRVVAERVAAWTSR